jgi:predicted phage terminase large subunit-like protein
MPVVVNSIRELTATGRPIFKPQDGPQAQFLNCSSPENSIGIVVYGGSAGSGKTYGVLLDPMRWLPLVPGFGGVVFRRTYPEITVEGALWDKSRDVYAPAGGKQNESSLTWHFPPFNNAISFRHLEHDKDVHRYQGAQICYMAFDELTTFTEYQFFYLLSRNRSTCGVQPYVRATCNPDPDSWVAEFIEWWIDQETGYPIPDRAGKVRWFIRQGNDKIWASTRRELTLKYPGSLPLSVTFIPAKITDNPALLRADPTYLSKLQALTYVERMRLLGGNWKIRAEAGTVFQREWFKIVDVVPTDMKFIRYWDMAATEPNDTNPDPDWTIGLLYAMDTNNQFYICDVVRMRKRPSDVEDALKATARLDTPSVNIWIEQEPGASGKAIIEHYARILPGYVVQGNPVAKQQSKLIRAQPASAAAEHGFISILSAPWNRQFLSTLEAFPTEGVHDDDVDALSGAHIVLTSGIIRAPAHALPRQMLGPQGYINTGGTGHRPWSPGSGMYGEYEPEKMEMPTI